MEPATQYKRTRFETGHENGTPLGAANSKLEEYCRSLHSDIAPFMLKLRRDHLLQLQKTNHRVKQVTNLSNKESPTPRSARVKFTLTCSKETETDEGYIRLKGETEEIVENFQSQLKEKILEVAKIEVKTYHGSSPGC